MSEAAASYEPGTRELLGQYRGVQFFEEPFTGIAHEGAILFRLHWLEASATKADPLAVRWELFHQLERADACVCVTARLEDGALIGYAVYLVVPHMHYQTIIADSDAYFIAKPYRKGWVGAELFRHAEELLRARGVNEVLLRLKVHVRVGHRGSDLEPFFHYLGYRTTEKVMRKRLN